MTREPPLPGPETLPDRADVVIVGGGLAGLGVALSLARAGVEALVCEARPALAEAGWGLDPGLVEAGTTEPPEQLLAALGPSRARAYVQLSRRSVALLRAHAPVLAPGCLRPATLPQEDAAFEASLAACEVLGLPAEPLGAAEVAALTNGGITARARHVPEDAQVLPREVLAALAEAACAEGARLCGGARVREVQAGASGLTLALDGGRTLRAELLVFAAGAGLAGLDPWFRERTHPVRELTMTWATGGPPGLGVSAQRGHLRAHRGQPGRVAVSGARWASPHLEAGEADDRAWSPRVAARLLAIARQAFAAPCAADPAATRARVQAHTCDNLPLVGPLPGRPRLAACAGFNGQDAALALECARLVALGLVEGRVEGIPDFLLPGRLI